jgi:hypothetical protein
VFETRVRRKLFGTREQESGENCTVGSFMICTANTIHQIKNNEMGGACGMYGGEERKGACRAGRKNSGKESIFKT